MRLSAEFRELIEQQESLDAKRTKVILLFECEPLNARGHEDHLLLLQMILASQATIAKQLLNECAKLTCEFIEWPHDLRA